MLGKRIEDFTHFYNRFSFWYFFLKDFCDNYLESVKKIVYNSEGKYSQDQISSAKYTLYKSLLTILKLIAPITPFIAEEIYHEHFKKFEKEKSIHISKWPEIGKEKSKGHWESIKIIFSKIRQEKNQKQLSLNAPLESVTLSESDYKLIKPYEERFLALSGSVCLKQGDFEIKPAGTDVKL